MKGFPGGMQQFLKQANQMQNKMKKLEEELEQKEYEATSGGDAIKVIATGGGVIKDVTIKEEVFESGDAEMLQDLFITAANEALKTAKSDRDKQMEKLTGGMSLPGLF